MLFAVLATANAAGYRYGASDQAFYIPVVTRALDPAAFPRDAALIDAQGKLMAADELIAAAVRLTGVPLPVIFFAAYLLSLALIWAALILIGNRLYQHRWTTIALGAAFTLRHRIPRTSANSFEPYFHPRMLAFGLGALAIAAVLRRRWWPAIALVAAAAVIHVTTAIWFAVLVGVALAMLDATLRRLACLGVIGAVLFVAWALTAGPLQPSLVRMDDLWLQAVASKDSLFATDWPLWAWFANLALLAILWGAHRWRVRHALASEQDRALAWGATALVAVFLVTLPAVAAHLALPVQLQISRVFWLIDFVATIYLLAVLEALPLGRHAGAAARVTGALLLALSAVRGGYVALVEHPERGLFSLGLPDSAWQDSMHWIAQQPIGVHVLADPGHAWKYGTSVRVAAARDVFLEEVKDSAMAIYSHEVAARVVERTAAIGDFGALTASGARDLARRYQLDYLVTPADLPLPLAYRNAQFRIYALR